MQLQAHLKKAKDKLNAGPSRDVLLTTRNWFTDRYESAQFQRNIFVVVTLFCLITITALTVSIVVIKSSSTIEPFVIEIEPKTGVPTYVDFKSSEIYKASEAVQRSQVWNYITSREEYFFSTYNRMFDVMRVMSSDSVFNDYRRNFSSRNPQSPYSLLGNNGSRIAELKSMIIDEINGIFVAQVRVRLKVVSTGSAGGTTMDKYIRMEFNFDNLSMNKNDRLLNPLGFYVTQYRITDDEVL